MSWYRAGTVSVTNGSAAVAGASTGWVANVAIGDSFIGPDFSVYEVQAVPADGSITLAGPYRGATAAGAAYAIQPTQDRVRALTGSVVQLINDYAAAKDGPGAGKFAAGTAAAPGIAFAGDTDTGLSNLAANVLAASAGGVEVLRLHADKIAAAKPIETSSTAGVSGIFGGGFGDAFTTDADKTIGNYNLTWKAFSDTPAGPSAVLSGYGGIRFYVASTERLRIRSDALLASVPLLLPTIPGLSGVIAGTLADAFTVDADKVMPHYGLTWKNFSDMPGAPGAALSGYGGVRLFAGGVERVYLTTDGFLTHRPPTTAPALAVNGSMAFRLESNTSLRIYVRGSDGVTRSATLPLA